MATNFLKPGPLVQATFNAMQKTYYFIDNNENKNLNDNSERESRMQWEFLKRKLIKTH
ncbi:unnamed protein product [Dracunculus medinensis]|uniref:Uncharacterized protein n=1 Tax=Dracunculus medinensis TaxID=318479 RepID=A0A0N4U9Q6_DRAME|nr:unnamed protein product [Dracunculus medinensis]